MYSVAICDDAPADMQRIADCVRCWAVETGCSVQVALFPSAEAFLFEYAENKAFDILLLDVEMTGMSGVDLAKHIRGENHRAEIIFITSHSEFSGEGYEVDALHYLIKPVAPQKLRAVLDKAVTKLQTQPRFVVVNGEGETLRLAETEILYVEAVLHYINIHTKNAIYKVKESISAFETCLGGGFFRLHRGYIVSLSAVVRITRTEVELRSGDRLPVSRTRYEALNRAFIQHH